ncbi:MAG TPA: DUF58 domain-containing protein [Acidiferrobacter sp.]|nr:DUF58 domain-containing protein [Acidiferrobacter sp.]
MSLAAWTLGRRSIYLLPTGEGLWFAGTLFVVLLAAMNYGNGLAYALTFLLAASATLSSAMSQRNLLGLVIHEGLPRADFARSPVGFQVIVVNPGPVPRLGITVTADKGPSLTVDLAAHERRMVEIPWNTTRRGLVPAPVVRVHSRYPFGLLRAFSRRIALQDPAIAYPAPAAHAALPSGQASADTDHEAVGPSQDGGGDFMGLAAFKEGESPRHIHWKAVAAGRGLLVKRFAGLAEREIWLVLPQEGDIEQRLSYVCRQVLEAERGGYRYGLVIGATRIPPGIGPAHLEGCLRTLALYDDAD